MRHTGIIAAIALAMPGIAMAQVGPNPAATGGSLDPTVGNAGDSLTSPADSGSPSMRTRSSAIGDTPDATATTSTRSSVDGGTVTTDASVGTDTKTTTRTTSGTKGMRRGKSPR